MKNQGVKTAPLPPEILAKLKEVTVQTLNDTAAKDPLVKKVHDSFMGFKSKGCDKWAGISEGRLPQPDPRTDLTSTAASGTGRTLDARQCGLSACRTRRDDAIGLLRSPMPRSRHRSHRPHHRLVLRSRSSW